MKRKIDFNYLLIITSIYLEFMLLLKRDSIFSCGLNWGNGLILFSAALGGLLLYEIFRARFGRYRWLLALLVCSVNLLFGIYFIDCQPGI